ncbi:MAG: recombinase family protein [Bryobacteraceae bacterium]
MNDFFAYVRVSTTRQGEHGVSLQEQRDAISRYAQRNGFNIRQWFEEQETAAKRGRPVFGQMLKQLRKGGIRGVIIHKIDRSARNLKDWADLGELIDAGTEVHFANESLDMTSRGGRLSADIQAVVASDYIRNLREETKKGFYGRLKQGILPMPAPLGYRNVGAGQPKAPDEKTAPLVRHMFELYAAGNTCYRQMLKEAEQIGLRGRSGKPITKKGISTLLNNPFYTGLIHIAKTGQTFTGVHEPLVSKALFDRVQDVLQGRLNVRTLRHDFLFRRRLRCKLCTYALIGETRKGFTYYRCHIRDCLTTAIREEAAETAILERFRQLRLSSDEQRFFLEKLQTVRAERDKHQAETIASLELQIAQADSRLARLTDAYIDRLIDRDAFEQRKTALLAERRQLQDSLTQWQHGTRNLADELQQILERANTAYLAYLEGTVPDKRDLVDTITSDRLLNGKQLEVMLNLPFNAIANRTECADGSPRRDTHRTWSELFPQMLAALAPTVTVPGTTQKA